MAIADDWDINYAAKVISHVDGFLDYGSGTGTIASVGDYIYGSVSGAVGKILAISGTAATGTLTLTNVVGLFETADVISIMDSVNFDGVVALADQGIQVGDTVTGVTSTRSGVVRAIEYNEGATAGEGTIYSEQFGVGAWTDNENLQVSAVTVALALGTGSDLSGQWLTVDVTTNLEEPGTVNTNKSTIIHYDAGSQLVPEDAIISDATTGAIGAAQKVIGSSVIGSIRIVNSDETGGVWTDGNSIDIEQVVNFDAQVAGEVFSVGDVVVGSVSGATGRVLAVIDDGDSTGRLILADETGTWNFATPDLIQVGGTTIAECENGTFTLAAATINIPDGDRLEQRTSQGGIYPSTVSLNIVRSANALYTYLQDTFDELGQLDDLVPMTAQVKDQAYTLVNGWTIPDLSMRFLEKGSFKDEGNNNIWTNYQTLGTIADIGDHGYFYDASNPTPQPNIYIEQDGVKLSQFWLEGNIDVIVKVKTSKSSVYIDPTVEALGQNINNGTVTVFSREYLRTYDHFQTTTLGGLAPIPLATADDLNNITGTVEVSYTGVGGFTIGEEVIDASGEIGIVTAEDLGTDDLDIVLKTAAFSAGTITGQVSGATATWVSNADIVAGYDTDIKVMVNTIRLTGGTTTVSTFVIGELVTQAVSTATGYILEDDAGSLYIEEVSGTFNGTNQVSGGVSGALNTPTGTNVQTTVPKDIGDGSGDLNYNAVISGNITDASAQGILLVYEWTKFITRAEETALIDGKGSEAAVPGQFYRALDTTYPEVKAAPFGTFAGGKMFGAQGVFIDKDTLATVDIQNIQLIDVIGTTVIPPNLQVIEVINLVNADSVSVYRTTGAGLTTILRNEFTIAAVAGTSNGTGDSIVEVKSTGGVRSAATLPADVPDTGIIRILDPLNTGNYISYAYTSVDRALREFTISGTLPGDLTEDDNLFVVFLEEDVSGTTASNTVQYVADSPLLIRVREKGILPFQTTGTFSSTGSSTGAIRTVDPIVNLP